MGFEMDSKKSFCWRSILSNGNIISAYARSENEYEFWGQVENDNFLVGNRVRIRRTGRHILDWIPFKVAPVKTLAKRRPFFYTTSFSVYIEFDRHFSIPQALFSLLLEAKSLLITL